MTPDQIMRTVEILTDAFHATRAAYYQNVDGVTYEHMRSAATRVLEWRGRWEASVGRKVTSKPTKGQIARMLRN